MRMEQSKANQPDEEPKGQGSTKGGTGGALLTPGDNVGEDRLRQSSNRSAASFKDGQGEKGYNFAETNEETESPMMDDNEIDDFCETSSWETSSEQEEEQTTDPEKPGSKTKKPVPSDESIRTDSEDELDKPSQ